MRKKRDRWRDYGVLRRRKEQVQSRKKSLWRSGKRWSPGNGECYIAAIAILPPPPPLPRGRGEEPQSCLRLVWFSTCFRPWLPSI